MLSSNIKAQTSNEGIYKANSIFRVIKQVADRQWKDGIRIYGKHQENGWISGSMYAVTNIIDYME